MRFWIKVLCASVILLVLSPSLFSEVCGRPQQSKINYINQNSYYFLHNFTDMSSEVDAQRGGPFGESPGRGLSRNPEGPEGVGPSSTKDQFESNWSADLQHVQDGMPGWPFSSSNRSDTGSGRQTSSYADRSPMTPLHSRDNEILGKKQNAPNINLHSLLKAITFQESLRTRYTKDFGTYIGRLRPHAHGISGSVYAVDERHLFVRNFHYDGTGPDAYFWVGDDKQPSPKGVVVPYPPLENHNPMGHKQNLRRPALVGTFRGDTAPAAHGGDHQKHSPTEEHRKPAGSRKHTVEAPTLKKMSNVNVLLPLPGQLKVTDIKWLSVWCRRFTVNFAEVSFPNDLQVPKPEVISPFRLSVMGNVSSGSIKVLDSESFYIPNLFLTIPEAGYNFYVGNSSDSRPNDQGQSVPDEKARFDDLHFYNGQDIIITLPSPLTVFDINYLAVFNVQSKHTLAYVSFDVSQAMIPPALGQTRKPGWWFDVPTTPPPSSLPPVRETDDGVTKETPVAFNHTLQLPNCKELLGRKIRLLWIQEPGSSYVYFRLKVHMKPFQFAALGIAAPGSPDIEADFIKVFFNDTTNSFQTQDAFLAKKVLCDFTDGLCADSDKDSFDHVTFMGATRHHGLSTIDFRRSIVPMDKHDAPIPIEGPVQVIVGIGSMRVWSGTSHHQRSNLNLETENVTIDFSSNGNTCPDRSQRLELVNEEEEGWHKGRIDGRNYFVALLGPTGGRKGYGAITGEPPSEKSVCWWINDKLLPEIYVERGKTYYFRVQGGDGIHHPELHHPFYITSDREGGYGHKNQYERERETIYAGVENQYGSIGMPGDRMKGTAALDGSTTYHGGIVGGLGGDLKPTGMGPLCELTSTDGADKASESLTFEDYRATLQAACEPNRAHMYGWVNWTVAMETPDLVFYQSYYGYGMGWKIHVLDEGEEPNQAQMLHNRDTYRFITLCLTMFSVQLHHLH